MSQHEPPPRDVRSPTGPPPKPSDAAFATEDAPAPVRSSVKIDQNAKGFAQLRVHVYEGTTEDEMQRIKDLAMQTYRVGLRELNAFTNVAQ